MLNTELLQVHNKTFSIGYHLCQASLACDNFIFQMYN